MKSDKLKKFETELRDLEQWQKLGLVPKKDKKKHEDEIKAIKNKIQTEHNRIDALKENGDEEFVAPKKSPRASSYLEGQTLPDIDVETTAATGNRTSSSNTINDTEMDVETDAIDVEETTFDEDADETTKVEEEEEDPFDDKNRWRRGIVDPDADDW
jgi:hypothetical protein